MLENCSLRGTKTCAMLHMPDCKDCPAANGTDPEKIAATVARFEEATAGADIAALLTKDECELCLSEKKQKEGYVIYDLGHVAEKQPEREDWKKLFHARGPEFDFLLPLQLPVCPTCRKRLWWSRYVVTVVTLAVLAIVLPFISFLSPSEKLRAVSRLLPLGLAVAALLIGLIGGKILRKCLLRRWEKESLLDVRKHPAADMLLKNGWRPVIQDSGKMPSVMYTKKALSRGLGTAPMAE